MHMKEICILMYKVKHNLSPKNIRDIFKEHDSDTIQQPMEKIHYVMQASNYRANYQQQTFFASLI